MLAYVSLNIIALNIMEEVQEQTVNHNFNSCLLALLKSHTLLLKTPQPIDNDCNDERWRCFQNCLGALDGTMSKVTPPKEEKSRYRTRKSDLAMNVLGVCCYYLVDGGYCNSEEFLAPDWEQRCHLNQFEAHRPKILDDSLIRGRGRNKCFWTANESKVLIEALQEIACDPM
ncbi:unnamed protein product [Coffea canephora]|uniref:DDE Tnp4 domain-containing protein n=1 Tax=Coffea canephora TaxID=49390 RepID=A0A068UBT0_COFCA|nr:unnamed protein product [Coffea canephora]